MSAKKVLRDSLKVLPDDDFEKFKWFLSMKIFDHCKPVPSSQLENALQTDAVDKMVTRYGEETAVNLAVDILYKMKKEEAAKTLLSAYKEAKKATASTSSSAAAPPAAAPAAISVSNGAVLIAPNVSSGSSTGQWNVTINK